MKKCEKCSKEILFPFICAYCGKTYCDEHRLPESHQCSSQPKEPPPYISPIASKTPTVGLCPKCHLAQSDMITYDAESMTFRCKRCGFKYGQLKASPHDYVEPRDKTEPSEKMKIEPSRRPRTQRHFPVGKGIGLILVVVMIVTLLWYAPTIISYFQNLSSPTNSSDESYTELTLRDLPITEVDVTVIEFGDTEYTFDYTGGFLFVNTFLGGSKMYTPQKGDIYRDFGTEVKVSDVNSDYISNYIVILVKPIVQNYSASLYYTKVSIALYGTKDVNISSGLINKTNQYWFSYSQITHPTFNEPQLTIQTTSQSKSYVVIAGFTIRDFEIETRVYKIESKFMVIYVKPLF